MSLLRIIPDHVCHESSTNAKYWLLCGSQWIARLRSNALSNLSEYAKLVHRIDNASERLQRLGLFTNRGLVYLQLNIVMIEICLHVLAIDIEDIQVHDGEASLPSLIALSKLVVLQVEDIINEVKVVLNLFVPFHMEAAFGFGNRRL